MNVSTPGRSELRESAGGVQVREARFGLVTNIAATFGVRVLLIVAQAAVGILAARLLGPEGRGAFVSAVTLAALGVQLTNFGLHSSNAYFVATDRGRLPGLLGNSVLAVMLTAGLCGGACCLASVFCPSLLPVHGMLLAAVVIAVPVGLGIIFFQSLLLGLEQIRRYNTVEVAGSVLSLGLLGGLILFQRISVETAYAMTVLASTATATLAFSYLFHEAGRIKLADWPLLKRCVPYGLKIYLACLFSFLVIRIDLFMVQRLLDDEQLGYYSVSVTMGDLLGMLPVTISTILFPRLSATVDPDQRWALTRRGALAAAGVTLPVALLFAVVPALPIGILFGDQFLPAAPSLRWLVPGIVMLSINVVLMNYFASNGMPMVAVWSPFAASVLNVSVNLWAIPRFGIVGAATSSTIAYGLMLAISLAYLVTTGWSCPRDGQTSPGGSGTQAILAASDFDGMP